MILLTMILDDDKMFMILNIHSRSLKSYYFTLYNLRIHIYTAGRTGCEKSKMEPSGVKLTV